MPDYCMCRDALCPNRHSCFRYRAVPNGWRQSYFAGPPHDDITACEHFMDTEGWPDKMLRPEGEEVELSEPEEKAIQERAAAIEARAQRAMAAMDPVGTMDAAADAARDRAKELLAKPTPRAAWAHLLETLTLTRDVTYSVVWCLSFLVAAPFVLLWRSARWLAGE